MISRRAQRALLIAVLVLVGLIAALSAFDTAALRGPFESIVKARTGRTFEIGGDFGLQWNWPPRLRMEQVRFANPDWAVEDYALQAEVMEATLALWPLLRGDIVLPDVRLQRPVVAIERSTEGVSNWKLDGDKGRKPDQPRKRPVIGRLRVEAGLLLVHQPARDTTLRVALQTDDSSDSASPTLHFRAEGRVAGREALIEGAGGSILSLADRQATYPFNLGFRIGRSEGRLVGAVTSLAALAGADVQLDLRGESMADAFPLLQLALPPTPPYELRGRLQYDGAIWRLQDFAGRFGDSDLSGSAELSTHDGVRRVNAHLVSRRLDLDDLAGIIGAPPQTGPGETASPGQKAAAAAHKARPTLLPDQRFRFERLRNLEGQVRFEAGDLRGRRLPIGDVRLQAHLRRGELDLLPLQFTVAGGKVFSNLKIDARGERLKIDADAQFRRIDLRQLFPKSEVAASNKGHVGGRLKLQSTGTSFADLLAHADGTLGLVSSGGRVSNLLLELIGLDGAEILRFLFGGDKDVRMRCAVADLELKQGVMHARSVVLDTTDTNIHVRGRLNMRDETLDLTVHPLPKDFSPATLRAPLHVRGSFKKPELQMDREAALRGGLAAALGAVAGPLAALLPLMETGPGDNADCARLVAAVQRSTGAAP